MKLLEVKIDRCKDCIYAGMYYTDCEAMHYRNRCEHSKVEGKVWIFDGQSIPDECPLPEGK